MPHQITRKPRRPITKSFVALGSFVLFGFFGPSCRDFNKDFGSCVGGVVVDGVCEGKCTPDKCLDQNTCVGNRCVLVCTSHTDCALDGSQNCAPAVEDDTGAPILACTSNGKAPGIGIPCPAGTECAEALVCPDGTGCVASQCGGAPETCTLDKDACKDIQNCTQGKCADGSVCRVGCTLDCAPWVACETSGEGDPNAYCTTRDCDSDADCIDGFYCGIVRDSHDVCGPTCVGAQGNKTCSSGPKNGKACSEDKDCQKGNDDICGQIKEDCLTPGQGDTSFEGSVCLLRKSCLKRGPGVLCKSDVECSRTLNQKCVDSGGEFRCAQTCASDFECLSDAKCDLAQGACVPRFGAWAGNGGFCEPCLSDEDCGKNGSLNGCAVLPGNGRACFDYSYPNSCVTDADCPESPGGLRGTCLDDEEGYSEGDEQYQRCSFPKSPKTGNPSCW